MRSYDVSGCQHIHAVWFNLETNDSLVDVLVGGRSTLRLRLVLSRKNLIKTFTKHSSERLISINYRCA